MKWSLLYCVCLAFTGSSGAGVHGKSGALTAAADIKIDPTVENAALMNFMQGVAMTAGQEAGFETGALTAAQETGIETGALTAAQEAGVETGALTAAQETGIETGALTAAEKTGMERGALTAPQETEMETGALTAAEEGAVETRVETGALTAAEEIGAERAALNAAAENEVAPSGAAVAFEGESRTGPVTAAVRSEIERSGAPAPIRLGGRRGRGRGRGRNLNVIKTFTPQEARNSNFGRYILSLISQQGIQPGFYGQGTGSFGFGGFSDEGFGGFSDDGFGGFSDEGFGGFSDEGFGGSSEEGFGLGGFVFGGSGYGHRRGYGGIKIGPSISRGILVNHRSFQSPSYGGYGSRRNILRVHNLYRK